MTNCVDCNQQIDNKTGLICTNCRVTFCIGNCLRNHSTHRLQNLPISAIINSKIEEAEKIFLELKVYSNALVDFIRNFDNEISNHQLKIFSLKDRLRNQQLSNHQVDAFSDKHNTVLKNISQMHIQVSQQFKDIYKFWGNIAAYNYDNLFLFNTVSFKL